MTSERTRSTPSLWSVWAPLPLLILVLLDWSFPFYFWRVPKLTGRSADYGYQFLLDVHQMERGKVPDSTRVLAFGSSVAGSFDPYQVQTLLETEGPHTPADIHRLLKPSMKPSDYRIFFKAELAALQPDVVVIMFGLQDFLNSSFERDLKPDVQYVMPPWTTLLERHRFISMSDALDLLLASGSNFYRYRKPLRSAVEDHARAAVGWLRRRGSRGGYGVYADDYTARRFGLPVGRAPTLDIEYFIEPAWIQQRGKVTIDFTMSGQALATQVETEPGWKTVHLTLPAEGDGALEAVSDSTWSPRAAGIGDDTRLLGVRLRSVPAGSLGNSQKPPFHYPPIDERDVDEFLRMGGATGAAFVARWNAALEAQTDFGTRLRAWRDTRLALRHTPFEPTGEYRELEGLLEDLTRHGISVILLNTPECPLIGDYQDGSYYRGYHEFFAGLAAKYPRVRFYDLLNSIPAEDFNDLMHVSYVGVVKLGPHYAAMVEQAIRQRTGMPATTVSEAHVDELLRAGVTPEQNGEPERAVRGPADPPGHRAHHG